MKANQKESEPQTRRDDFIFVEFGKIVAARQATTIEKMPGLRQPGIQSRRMSALSVLRMVALWLTAFSNPTNRIPSVTNSPAKEVIT